MERPVTMRLERSASSLRTGTATEIELPAATIIQASLAHSLSPQTAKKGDPVDMVLIPTWVEGKPDRSKGSRVTAVDRVTKPGVSDVPQR